MFVQQPNRRFVRNLLLTQEICHLFHFDRSGAQYSQPINIHDNPALLIRLILGLSSYDERVLGFDPAVRWDIREGRKVSGAVTISAADGTQREFTLCDVHPVFRRYNIRGRGTTGWSAIGDDGVHVFIKDSWRPDETGPEYNVLKHTRDVDAAAHMIAYEAGQVTTADLRANGVGGWSMEGFSNRTSTRVVVEMCGQSILHFKSQWQLFAAIRDAIAGTLTTHFVDE